MDHWKRKRIPEKHPLLLYWLRQHLWLWQFSSVAQSCPTLCNPMDCSTPGFPVHHHCHHYSQSLLRLMSIKSVMPSNHLTLCCPLRLLPSFSFPMSWFFVSGDQRIGVSALASVLPMNIQGWFHLGWTGWISQQSKGLSRVFSNPPQFKSINSLVLSFLYSLTLISIMTTGKTIALTRQIFVGKVMLLLFNMLSRLVITFLPRSKHLLISWLQSPSAVILEPKK